MPARRASGSGTLSVAADCDTLLAHASGKRALTFVAALARARARISSADTGSVTPCTRVKAPGGARARWRGGGLRADCLLVSRPMSTMTPSCFILATSCESARGIDAVSDAAGGRARPLHAGRDRSAWRAAAADE
jgi:hypothetical protein